MISDHKSRTIPEGPIIDGSGVYRIGMANTEELARYTDNGNDVVILSRKIRTTMDAGYYYCPYIPRFILTEKTMFDIESYLNKQYKWSDNTFGVGDRTVAILKHIEKEIAEIRADPTDLVEWIDIIQLAFDGARRSGAAYNPDGRYNTIEDILQTIAAKQDENELRAWPDWRTHPIDQPIEHIKE